MQDKQALDRLDSEFVIETVESRGYKLIEDRMKRVYEDKMRELRLAPLDQVQKIQGLLAGLERAMSIPGEIVAAGKKNEKG